MPVMNGYGYPGYGDAVHHQRTVTPYEKCRSLLIELRMEQRKGKPDADKLADLFAEIYSFQIRTIVTAFDSVVDECGWCDTKKKARV